MPYLPKWNTITPNYKVHLPDRWIFFDTETREHRIDGNTTELTFRLGVGCYWRRGRASKAGAEEWREFLSADALLDWLISKAGKRKTVYCAAHNLPFDLLALKAFSGLARRGFRLTRVYHRMTTSIVRFANGDKRLCFIDSMNYYPVKLKALAEHIGLIKSAMPERLVDADDWLDYCRNDVRIVKTAIARLLATLERDNLGSFRPTGPALAFNIFRHRFMKHTIRPHHIAGVANLERTAYVGGYTMPFSLFYRNGEPLYKLDVNSMYPAVMSKHSYPTTLARRLGRLTLAELQAWLKTNLVIARVTVKTEEPYYPYRAGGHVVYPTGTFSTVLCSRGLEFALARREAISCAWALVYKGEPIFQAFVAALYRRKARAGERSDRAGLLFYKMLLNGLYGKFGQRATETKALGDCDPNLFYSEQEWIVDRHQWANITYAGGAVRMSVDAGETRNSFPAVAAHVTEDARLRLFSLVLKAGRENVLYCDTDSLIVNATGLGNLKTLISARRLGYLKVEKAGDTFVSMGKKDYLFGGERVLKGFKNPANDFFFQAQVQEQFSSLPGALAMGQREAVYVKQVLRTHEPHMLGVRIGSDLSVNPMRLPEDLENLTTITYLRPHAYERLAQWINDTAE